MDSKANQKKLEKVQNSLKSTQKPPNSMPRGSPTSPVGNTAGAVTTKQQSQQKQIQVKVSVRLREVSYQLIKTHLYLENK